MSKLTSPKKLNEIAIEWNAISHKRQTIIEHGKDVSLEYVTSPCIMRNLGSNRISSVLDAGCGTGYLTKKISSICDFCYGIDISEESIRIAQERNYSPNIIYQHTSISNLEVSFRFDACVSNMVIISDPDWESSLMHIYDLLNDGGKLLLMLSHPCFWPHYWNYSTEPWFDYFREIYIEHEFSTSLSETLGISTHIHRPLSAYLDKLNEVGFDIIKIEEPQPIPGTPSNYQYHYPRFLFIKCQKKEQTHTSMT